jgi:lipoprotein signal peptidase
MSVTEGQRHYLAALLVWLVALQGVMFWYLVSDKDTVCNSFSAWPLHFTGSFLITAFVTLLVGLFSWKRLAQSSSWQEVIGLGAVTAAGVSHTLERATSGCVLDYWPLPLPGVNHVFFNLGDLSLFLAVLGFLYGYGLVSKK